MILTLVHSDARTGPPSVSGGSSPAAILETASRICTTSQHSDDLCAQNTGQCTHRGRYRSKIQSNSRTEVIF